MTENTERTWAQRLRDIARKACAERAVFNESTAKEWLTNMLREADAQAADGKYGVTLSLRSLNEKERRYVLDHCVDDYGLSVDAGGPSNTVFISWVD